MIFGFTGTPIQDLNAKKDSTTPTIFGDEIHRYTLGDGIRDKNVLPGSLKKRRLLVEDNLTDNSRLWKSSMRDRTGQSGKSGDLGSL